jgi:regulatory protein
VSVFLDERFAFGMHRDLLLKFELAVGMELSVDVQSDIARRDAFFKARAVACRYLSYRERSTSEVRRRLQRDDYPSEVTDDVLHHLEEAGLVDDRRFATAYAEMRFRSRGYGPIRVHAELRKKGIEPAAVEAVLEDVFAERDELLDRAREAGAKRWEVLTKASTVLERKKKVYDHLARRGYRFDMIRRVVDELEDL